MLENINPSQQPISASLSASFEVLRSSSNALVTTFKRDGSGVGTPVNLRLKDNGKAYFTTWSTTWKVKRLSRDPHVTLAPCTRRGKPTGPTVHGTARLLEGAEAEQMWREQNSSFMGKLWLLIYRLQRVQPVFYEVSPVLPGEYGPN